MDTKSAHIVIVIVYGNINKKPLHAKTIRLGSGMCLGPTQRPEEQGQPLREREETFKCRKLYLFLSKSDTEGKRTSTTHKNAQLMKYLIFEHVVDQILSISAMQKYEHTHTHQVVEVNEYR